MSEIEDYTNAKQRCVEREKSMCEGLDCLKQSDALKDRWYKLGQANAFACSAKILMDNATEYFRDDNDLVANDLRRLSQKISKLGEDIHPGPSTEKG